MSDTIDNTDDWMNPPPSRAFAQSRATENDPTKVEYLIERAYSTIVSGNVGSIVRWREWLRRDTAAERDEEIIALSEAHPMWMLRKRDRYPWYEDRGLPSPNSGPHPGINP